MDARAQPATTEDGESAIWHLTTPVIIKPGSTVIVQSESAIEFSIGPYSAATIRCHAPTPLSSKMVMHLQPLIPLGSAFVRGWDKLPAELKLMVVKHNVAVHEPIKLHYPALWGEDEPPMTIQTSGYLSHLRMTPEIAALAEQAFYESSTFQIEMKHQTVTLQRIEARSQFQHVVINIPLNDLVWPILRFLASAEGEMRSLRSLQVNLEMINWRSSLTKYLNAFAEARLENKISFSCAGSVNITKDRAPEKYVEEMSKVRQIIASNIKFNQPTAPTPADA